MLVENLIKRRCLVKLFDGFEAVKFVQENLIFITHEPEFSHNALSYKSIRYI